MRATAAPPLDWLDAEARARLSERLRRGLRQARAAGEPALVSVTGRCAAAHDPTAVVAASRLAGEQWLVFEQPARERMALATLGCARAVEADGPDRFAELSRRWGRIAASALADPCEGPAGSGLIAAGGLAFAPDGCRAPAWGHFPAASLTVPEVALARRGSDVRLTLCLEVAPDDTVDDLEGRVNRRLGSLRDAPLPLLDPAPAGRFKVSSTMPPAHYEEAVARAVERIRARELEKLVLAREVEVHAPSAYDPAAILGVLREGFESCYVYAAGREDATFIGASPELLVRRDGHRASTVALAGSARRSADPAVDDHLGERLLRSDKDREENAIVARRIARALRPHALWVTAAPEPVLVRVANIQHLGMPIRAQLRAPLDALELAGALHPTPAVGGEPAEAASELIPALEGLDRGWYAAPLGYVDAGGDGEFCVALRCALLRGNSARCYAGCGIVRDSDPAAELAETEVKLQALLPVLAG